jgi:HK97 family phage portal protein
LLGASNSTAIAPRAATQELISPISRTPEEIQRELARGNQSESFGAPVTLASALSVATVYACVRILADSIGMLPLTLYRKEGERQIADYDSPLGILLASAPTPLLTPYEFWRMVITHMLLRGNFYAQKVTYKGQVETLLPLNPDYVMPKMDDGATITYEYRPPNKQKVVFKAVEIFHLRNLCTDGLAGLSTLKAARNAIGVAIQGESHAGNMLRNGARPSGAFTMEGELPPEAYERLRNDLDAKYSGPDNSGRPLLLESGLKFEQMQLSAEDSQFMESRAFQRGEICIFFGIPPQLIGDVAKGTSWGTGVEQQNLAFLTHTLKPYLVNIQQAVIRSLVAPKDLGKYVAKFDVSELTKADFFNRQNGWQVMRRNGVLSANEWRKKEGLDPIEDPKADEYLVDQTLIEEPLDPNAGSSAEPDDASSESESNSAVSAFGTR